MSTPAEPTVTNTTGEKGDVEAVEADDGVVLAPLKGRKIGPITVPPWRAPISQVILVGFVCFMCPGMFNALSGMGGGGQVDGSIAAKAQTALYTTFAVVGFSAGTFLNYFGAKPTLAIGGLGYAVYVAAFLCYNHTANEGFVIFSGAFLGICASFLWCAQGTVMMSYPTEDEKGRYIGLFWAIFNTGAVLGSLIPLGTNWKTNEVKPVEDGTYIGFLVLMVVGAILAFALVPPQNIIRKDGTRVQKVNHPSMVTEIMGIWKCLWTDSYILWLFPFFLASNWFYTYQFNAYNLYMFNTRTRAFTGLFYWLAQIVGSVAFGYFLDTKRFARRKRAIGGWIILFILVNAIWGGGLAADLEMERPPDMSRAAEFYRGMDIFSTNFTWYVILYICYGFMDAIWQTYAYWMMGALSNEPRTLAYFAGFYKGIQSAGAAIVWGIDSDYVSYRALFGSSWGLCAGGLLLALPVVWWRIKDTELKEEDFVPGLAAGKTEPVGTAVDAEEAGVAKKEQIVEKTMSAESTA